MPLQILIPMVVAGIAGIALLTHLLGLSRAHVLREPEQALAAWAREFPDIRAYGASLSADGHAALIDTEAGPGLVWVMGADTVARPLDGSRVSAARRGVTVRFDEFGAPVVSIALNDRSDFEAWKALFTQYPEGQPT